MIPNGLIVPDSYRIAESLAKLEKRVAALETELSAVKKELDNHLKM